MAIEDPTTEPLERWLRGLGVERSLSNRQQAKVFHGLVSAAGVEAADERWGVVVEKPR